MKVETSWGTISAIDEGDGPAIVLLHPLAQCGEFWRPLIDELSPQFRVLAPDARGHGASNWNGEPFSVLDMASDVAALLSHAGESAAAVLGMSMGGCTAIALSARRPELVSRLVLADTTADYGPDKEKAWAARALTAVEKPREQQLGFQHDRWFSPHFLEAGSAEVARVSELFLATDSEAHAAASRALGGYNDVALLPTIKAPTLVVVGDEDYATPPDMARALEQGIPGAELEILPETRHLSLIQNRAVWPRVIAHLTGAGGHEDSP